MDQHGHAERSPELGDGASAGPVAQKGQGGAAQFVSGFSRPLSGADSVDHGAQASRGDQHQRHGQFGDGVVVNAGGVAYPDSPRRGSGDVDRVVAHAAAGDDLQFGGLGEHVGGDRLAGHDGTGDTVEQGERFVGRPRSGRRAIADLMTVAAQ